MARKHVLHRLPSMGIPHQALLYGAPAGAVEVVSLILAGYLGDKLHNRLLVSRTGALTSIIGMILTVSLPPNNTGGRLAGYYMTQAGSTAFVPLLSLVATNVAGYTTKTGVAALYLTGYCIGNISGPQTFQPGDKPRYIPADITIIVAWGIGILDVLFIY